MQDNQWCSRTLWYLGCLILFGCGESQDPASPADCRAIDAACATGSTCQAAADGTYHCAPPQATVEAGQPNSTDGAPMAGMNGAPMAAPSSDQDPAPDTNANPDPTSDPGTDPEPDPTGDESTEIDPPPDGQGETTVTPGDCTQWPLAMTNPVDTVYQQLRDQYRPIAVEVDLGGNLNRYTTARMGMFTQAERHDAGGGEMVVECVYTGTTAPAPADADPPREAINCEHVMPRSRMVDESANAALYEHQQSDMHNLMPSVPGVNSARGSFRFGTVTGDRTLYGGSILGRNAGGDTVFQVRESRRGDIARIVFYFSVRWGIDIASTEEAVLRSWSASDPVDAREQTRNAAIAALQGTRNPFVDCPELVEAIGDFTAFDLNGETLPLP